MLSFQGVPLHEEDEDMAKPGRHFFAVKEVCWGHEVLRLQRLCPRNTRGEPTPLGPLGTFGAGMEQSERTSLGAVEVVGAPGALTFSRYPLEQMREEADLLEDMLRNGGVHAH